MPFSSHQCITCCVYENDVVRGGGELYADGGTQDPRGRPEGGKPPIPDPRVGEVPTAKGLGATFVVNGAEEGAVARVRELTGGEGVEVAFEALGLTEIFEQASAMLMGGLMVPWGSPRVRPQHPSRSRTSCAGAGAS